MKTYQIDCKNKAGLKACLEYLESLGFKHSEFNNSAKTSEQYIKQYSDYLFIKIYPKTRHYAGNYSQIDNVEMITFEQLFQMTFAPEFKEVKLNDSHSAQVYKDKIVVGCQTFPVEIMDKLRDAWESVKSGV